MHGGWQLCTMLTDSILIIAISNCNLISFFLNTGYINQKQKSLWSAYDIVTMKENVSQNKSFSVNVAYCMYNNPTFLKKCNEKLDCLIYEMLFIRKKKASPNTQSASIRAKLFFLNIYLHIFTQKCKFLIISHLSKYTLNRFFF